MKHTLLYALALCCLSLAGFVPLGAQNCPAPGDLHIEISNANPPVAHVSWSPPAGGNIAGYTLTYSIDGQAPVAVNLPPASTQYDIVLPESWVSLEVTIVSVCENGNTSTGISVRKTSIVLTDLVLVRARNNNAAEASVCLAPCKEATHFFYSQNYPPLPGAGASKKEGGKSAESGLNLNANAPDAIVAYKIDVFCGCMAENDHAFSDQTVVDGCKQRAQQTLSFLAYEFSLCSGGNAAERSEDQSRAFSPKNAVWPNPATDYLHFDLRTQAQLVVTDLSGKIVLAQNLDANAVDIRALAPGVYFYRIASADPMTPAGKFIKL